MAHMRQDSRTGNWLIHFRWSGKQFTKSTETKREREAAGVLARVEETIRLLKQGRISIPVGVNPGVWIISEGKLREKPTASKRATLTRFGEVAEAYLADQLDKAETTLEAERKHIRHLNRVLGKRSPLRSLDLDAMQQYVNHRVRQKHRGRTISGPTVRKELVTFHQVWAWARERSFVETDCPIYNQNHRWAVKIPKPTERPKFQTWSQIERLVKRNDLTSQQQQELWGSLFLDENQVVELLQHVKKQNTHPFIYPMFVFAAYSGARRGEILRSQIDDFDFEQDQVMIRERKRRKDMEQTYRFVPLHPKLRDAMKKWFGEHAGGAFTITAPLEMSRRATRPAHRQMSPYEAHHHFKHTLRDSKWSVTRGFHVLRHSFGSNLARSGEVSRDRIAEWMGHTTEEMKTLYQHLFPQDGQSKISVLR